MTQWTESPLDKLVERTTAEYRSASSERAELHKLECESEALFSVLGEAEVFADGVVGIVGRVTRSATSSDDIGKFRERLFAAQLGLNPVLSRFLRDRSGDFPLFCRYVVSVEELRKHALTCISARQDAPPG